MSDLPDRDENGYVGQDRYNILTAYTRGDLKSRDEMDLEAAMRKFKEFWDRPFADKDQDTLRAVLDAAWGVDDD